MRGLGCSIPQIALEMGRRFNLRPRLAWRQALGWPQWKVAQRYNTLHPGTRLSDHRVSEYETWPHGGAPFSLRYLVRLATTYGHGCTPSQLVDADDLEHLTPTDRCLLTSVPSEHSPAMITPETSQSAARTMPSNRTNPDRVLEYRSSSGTVQGGRRIVRCDARGMPVREEVIVAAEESAQFHRWSAATNVSGTALFRLASQQARIHAARQQPGEVSQALTLAATASTERTVDEPGIFGFSTGTAAYYASEAHYALGGTADLNAAVDWARTALEEFTAETQPKALHLAAARFDLALAHLARGELDAVGEHLAPVLGSTQAEYRTVPVIGRARSLNTLLAQRTDLASPTLAALSEDLTEFCTHPAPTPPGLETEATT